MTSFAERMRLIGRRAEVGEVRDLQPISSEQELIGWRSFQALTFWASKCQRFDVMLSIWKNVSILKLKDILCSMMLSLYLKELQTVFVHFNKIASGCCSGLKNDHDNLICPGNLGRLLGPTVVEIWKCKKMFFFFA